MTAAPSKGYYNAIEKVEREGEEVERERERERDTDNTHLLLYHSALGYLMALNFTLILT